MSRILTRREIIPRRFDPRPPWPCRRRCPFEDGEGSVCAHRNHDARTKRAYVLADNKLAMNAGWDEELLAEELKGLLEIDLDFDIGVTGFSIPEIDSLIDGLAPEEPGNPGGSRRDARMPRHCG